MSDQEKLIVLLAQLGIKMPASDDPICLESSIVDCKFVSRGIASHMGRRQKPSEIGEKNADQDY